jgi:hypothetical protein
VKKIYGGWDKLLSIQIASPAHTWGSQSHTSPFQTQVT